MDGGNDGTLIDQWRYMLDPAGMDWVGCCDHDNGGGREYSWWTTQKLTDIFYSPEKFVPMFSYERSVAYPEGHRNVVFATRGIRTLPRLPKMDNESTGHAPDTADALPLPAGVRRRGGVAHQRHQHGDGLARQRSAHRAGGGDLPGRPAELRDARCAAEQFRGATRSADGGRKDS